MRNSLLSGFKSFHTFVDKTKVFVRGLDEGGQFLRQLGNLFTKNQPANGFSPFRVLSEDASKI